MCHYHNIADSIQRFLNKRFEIIRRLYYIITRLLDTEDLLLGQMDDIERATNRIKI